ncbi:hypothetical protein N9422_03725 [Candidatus Pelagibacter sp.]|nr:hypothetical protein [Candidatus Pelagibacter sp.]
MYKIRKLLPILLVTIFLSNCGYTPKYAVNKNLNFSIEVIELSGDREFNNSLRSKLSKYIDNDNIYKKKFDLSLKTSFNKYIKSKDSAGLAKDYELVIIVDALIKSELIKPKKLVFEEKFIMKKLEDTFDEKNYEKIIKENLSDVILNRIIFYLYKL